MISIINIAAAFATFILATPFFVNIIC
jgi:hypothetical protein